MISKMRSMLPPKKNQSTEDEHATVIIGYGTSADGVPYWLVMDSSADDTQGQEWGVGGVGKVVRGRNVCNIENDPYVALP